MARNGISIVTEGMGNREWRHHRPNGREGNHNTREKTSQREREREQKERSGPRHRIRKVDKWLDFVWIFITTLLFDEIDP
jgi:hypothetical protein